MDCGFLTDQFEFQYKENRIESRVLWESHCHAQFELLAVLEGDISIMLEGKIYRLTANQAVIIPPLFYHTVTANKKGDYRRLTVLFDIAAVPLVLQPQFLQKNAEISIFFSDRLEELKKICKKHHPLYTPLAESLMIQIFYDEVQAAHTEPNQEIDASLQEILSYIDAHICEKMTLDQLASYTARSKSSVCHLFQEKMKISPKQYILRKKLALAVKLIRTGTPPTIAAMQVGYENYSNFYRMYKKNYETKPSEDKSR